MATGYESISVSFSKKNSDVWDILTNKKKDITFNQNDYVCEAIRFYEKNKDKINQIANKEEIKRIVDERIEEFKQELLNNNIEIKKKDNDSYLENISDDINIDDD